MLRLLPRSSVIRAARAVRCASSSTPDQASTVVDTVTTATTDMPTDIEHLSSSSSHFLVSEPAPFSLTSGLDLSSEEKTIATRKHRPVTANLSLHDKCLLLSTWTWFEGNGDKGAQKRLKVIIDQLKKGSTKVSEEELKWALRQYELAKSFRLARSRLWKPADMTDEEVMELIRSKGLNYHNTSNQAEYEKMADKALVERWLRLTDEERKEAIMRVRYECARRLGWRKGYSSGFPLDRTQSADDIVRSNRLKLLEELGSKKESIARKARTKLIDNEEEVAWQAWREMSNQSRAEEEKTMWTLRDRSMIFIDDSTSTILGTAAPRWYHEPQKIGDMTFLPNVIVRLVRNNTPRNGIYDAFKATFRVPLYMHKHGLRAYLLAIYGLRTTWCRSTIYRASIQRSRFGQLKVGPANRTFKKVEVGLLEPFVFPEISNKFLTEQLMMDEMKHEQARLYLKLSGKRRVRNGQSANHKSVRSDITDSSGASIENGHSTTRFDGNTYTTIPKREDLNDKVTEQPFSIWGGKERSVKKSSILRRVHEMRKVKEQQIAERVKDLKVASENRSAD